MIQAVIIDLDDTLCLTEAACFEMENEILRRLGRPPMTRAIHQSTWGRPLLEAIKERSPGVDVPQFQAQLGSVIREYVDAGKLDAIPDSNYAALDQLIRMGKHLMVLTSRRHDELEHLLAPDHLLAKRVTAFYYRDNMQYHKPDPRAFDELLKIHDLKPEHCIYVGDSPSDAQAASEAGLKFVASLESGLRREEDFAAFQVDAFIPRFVDIVSIVEELDGRV